MYEDKVIKSRGMVYGTFTTVGGSEDEKQQPEPEADVEVEGVDGADGDTSEEGDEVTEGL